MQETFFNKTIFIFDINHLYYKILKTLFLFQNRIKLYYFNSIAFFVI